MTTSRDPRPCRRRAAPPGERAAARRAGRRRDHDRVRADRVRRTLAAILAGLTAVLLVLSVVATWTSRTALDTDKFVARVGPVVQDPTVRAALATELGDELVQVLDLQSRITPVLPDNLRFISGPLAAGADNFVRSTVTKFVDSEQFVQLWYAALRVAHTQVVSALTGSTKSLQVVDGKVVINLIPVIGQVVDQLVQDLPALVGTALAQHIPDNIPVDQIRSLVTNVLGVNLPDDFGLIPVMDASTLETAQTGIKVVNLSVVLLLVVALAVFLLALVASVDRRRTLVQIGLATAILTGIVFFVARTLTDSAITGIARRHLASGCHCRGARAVQQPARLGTGAAVGEPGAGRGGVPGRAGSRRPRDPRLGGCRRAAGPGSRPAPSGRTRAGRPGSPSTWTRCGSSGWSSRSCCCSGCPAGPRSS